MKQYTRSSGVDEDGVQYYYLASGDKVISSGQFLPSGDSNFFDFAQDFSYNGGSGINYKFPDPSDFPFETSGTLQTSGPDDYSFDETRESGIFHYENEKGNFSNAHHVWAGSKRPGGIGKERQDWSISGQFFGPGVLENDDIGNFNPMIYYSPDETMYINNEKGKYLRGVYINYLSDYGNQVTNPVTNTFGLGFIPQSPYYKKK